MTVYDNKGATQSTKTAQDKATELQELLKNLSPAEKESLELVLQDLQKNQTNSILDTLRDSEYIRPLVTMEEFVKNPYYLGNTCGDTVYPALLDDLNEIEKGGYETYMWVGSTRTGKSFISSILFCWELYRFSCMRNPQKSLGLAPGSKISGIVISVSEQIAREVAFDNIVTKISASPYFNECFKFKDNKNELIFPNNIIVVAKATTDRSALGHNIAIAWIDEAAFLSTTNKIKMDPKLGYMDNAQIIYQSLKTRMKNTFKQSKYKGVFIISSSKSTVDDFLARYIREHKNDPSLFLRDRNAWTILPELYEHSEKFYVLSGNELMSSRIIPPEDMYLYHDLPDDVAIIEVPEEFRADFEGNLEASLRDLAGLYSTAVSPFIQRREKIVEACDTNKWPSCLKNPLTKQPILQHNFSVNEWDPAKPGEFIWEHMCQTSLEREYDGSYTNILRPIINPKAVRVVHLDPAFRGDGFGFAMAHIAGVKDVKRRAQDGKIYSERAPVFVVDFVLRITPPLGGEIEMATVRHLVYQLTKHGYNIGCVSMDKYVRDGLQPFTAKGYHTEWLSVDETTAPYDSLKTSLYENRIHFYRYDKLVEELQLIEKKYEGRRIKVDHQPGKSKDCADAVAGAIYQLSKKDFSGPLPMLKDNPYDGDPWLNDQLGEKAKDIKSNKDVVGFPFSYNSDPDDENWFNLG